MTCKPLNLIFLILLLILQKKTHHFNREPEKLIGPILKSTGLGLTCSSQKVYILLFFVYPQLNLFINKIIIRDQRLETKFVICINLKPEYFQDKRPRGCSIKGNTKQRLFN